MPVNRVYLDYIIDQLKVFGPVTAKRMFGGAGLYHQGLFFGLIADDALYFKVDDTNKTDYEAAGSGPFRPFGSHAMSYYGCRLTCWRIPTNLASGQRRPSRRMGGI